MISRRTLFKLLVASVVPVPQARVPLAVYGKMQRDIEKAIRIGMSYGMRPPFTITEQGTRINIASK